VQAAAREGDPQAGAIYAAAGRELAAIVLATRRALRPPARRTLDVSYSGGVFGSGEAVLAPFARALEESGQPLRLTTPRFSPGVGAALFAARCHGTPLDEAALAVLQAEAA
jgi:N-acetylglucosamine kinase-like BadF-type ATPase